MIFGRFSKNPTKTIVLFRFCTIIIIWRITDAGRSALAADSIWIDMMDGKGRL